MKLSVEQEKAISHFTGPALVLAVPGAGKTTVLLHRTVNLIRNYNVSPERILSITFSKASARDMKERFMRNFSDIPSQLIYFSTIHAFCYSLIKDYADIKRIRYTLIEDHKLPNNKFNLLKKIYYDLNKDYITEEKLETLLSAIGYIKNMLISPDEYLKNNKTDIDNFIEIYNLYEDYKKRNNLLDFDDMLTISREILLKDRYLLEKYRRKYDFIQVDEGQDTSRAQMEIIYLLGDPKNNLFIVADDDQSIYGFRGAYPKGLFEFNKKFPQGKLFFMEHNYRSSKNIVSISNKFIQKNTIRYKKNIITDNKYMEPINIIKVHNIYDEYKFLIEDLKDQDLTEACILFRNNLSAVGVIETLEKHKIPFTMKETKLNFFNHWVIKDIINFMTFAQDTSQLSLYEEFYYKMKGYISKKQIQYAKTLDHNINVFDRIMTFPGLSEHYKRTLRDLKFDFKKLSSLKPINAIKYIEYNLEYDEYLKENSLKFGFTYENLATILFYLKLIAKDSIDLNHLVGRLKYLQHLMFNSRDESRGVTLSTVHSIKGLEFESVYLIDLIDGDFPSQSSIDNFEKGKIEDLEEERRLFYVGMTRAKRNLNLITMKSIEGKKLVSSRFLKELEEYI